MILNQEDRNNLVFELGTNSDKAQQFKQSKRGQWISKMLRFKDIMLSDTDENLSKTALKFSPMELLLRLILDTFDSDLGPT